MTLPHAIEPDRRKRLAEMAAMLFDRSLLAQIRGVLEDIRLENLDAEKVESEARS